MEYYVRSEIAKHGRPQDLDILVKDKYPNVLDQVLERHRKEYIADLYSHSNPDVRQHAPKLARLIFYNPKELNEYRNRNKQK